MDSDTLGSNDQNKAVMTYVYLMEQTNKHNIAARPFDTIISNIRIHSHQDKLFSMQLSSHMTTFHDLLGILRVLLRNIPKRC